MEKTNFEIYAVILAGGSGTRFWPKSRQKTPKQLCQIGGSRVTMLETTLNRLNGLIPPKNRLIVTHRDQVKATQRIARGKCLRVIAEPEARNTANALALAALEIEQLSKKKSALMISLHADALITKVDQFKIAVKRAMAIAATGKLTLMGITPRYPETGYGYIEKGNPLGTTASDGFHVKSFREKPDRSTAESYVKNGSFLWNSGIFAFPIEVFLTELSRRLPESVSSLKRAMGKHGSFTKVPAATLSRVYRALPKIAVDHAVLEVAADIAVVEADIGWQDIGSWDALATVFPTDQSGNLHWGQAVLIDTTNTVVETDGPLIATIGLQDMIVVHARGAILVCPKSRAQDVKKIVEELQRRKIKNLI